MENKGLTPVIAIVLLISVTIAAAGAIVQYLDLIEEVSGDTNADEILADLYISHESCWEETSDSHDYNVQFRQTHPENAIDVSEFLILKEGQEPIVTFDGGQDEDVVVDPGNTFIVELEENQDVTLDAPFGIEVISGNERESIICT